MAQLAVWGIPSPQGTVKVPTPPGAIVLWASDWASVAAALISYNFLKLQRRLSYGL